MEKKKLIEFRNIVKNFDGNFVLKGVNLDIYEKEFVTLLGPSGFIGAMIQSNAVLTQTTASYSAATMAVISHQVVKNAEKIVHNDTTKVEIP